jgi:hypothetical protein
MTSREAFFLASVSKLGRPNGHSRHVELAQSNVTDTTVEMYEEQKVSVKHDIYLL